MLTKHFHVVVVAFIILDSTRRMVIGIDSTLILYCN